MALKRGAAAQISPEGLEKEYDNRGQYSADRLDYLDKEAPRIAWRDNQINHWRVVPPPVGESGVMQSWGLGIHVHRNIGPDGGWALCLTRQWKMPCPICEHQKTLWDEDAEAAKKLYPQERMLANAIDMLDQSKGVQIADMPKRKLYDAIIGQCRSPETGAVINIADITNGVDVYFERPNPKGGYPDYTSIQLGKTTNDVTSFLTEGTFDLPALLVQLEYEDLRKLFYPEGNVNKVEDVSSPKVKTTSPPPKIEDNSPKTPNDMDALKVRMQDMGSGATETPGESQPETPDNHQVAAEEHGFGMPESSPETKGPFD